MSSKTEEQPIFPQPDVIDLVALFKLLWSKKWIIMGSSFLVAVITAVITLQMPNIYKSTTTLLPVSGDSNSLSQYAGLAAMAGVSLPSQGGTDVEKIMALLNSRTLKERVINDLDLTNILLEEQPTDISPMYATLTIFSENYSASQDKKTNVIAISYEDKNPELAAKIVNHTAVALSTVLEEKSLTLTSKKLALTEKQLNKRRVELDRLKNKLLEFQRRTQTIVPESQAEGVMKLYTSLVQQKITLEVELETLENALSDTNPKIIAKKQQLEAVVNQLNNISNVTSDGKFDTTDVPENIAEYTEITAELELAQKMYISLYTQWEQLKLQEQEDQLFIETIDEGQTPEKKIGPRRSRIVILFSFLSFIVISLLLILPTTIRYYINNNSRLKAVLT